MLQWTASGGSEVCLPCRFFVVINLSAFAQMVVSFCTMAEHVFTLFTLSHFAAFAYSMDSCCVYKFRRKVESGCFRHHAVL